MTTVFYIYGYERFTKKHVARRRTNDPSMVHKIKLELSDLGLVPYVVPYAPKKIQRISPVPKP